MSELSNFLSAGGSSSGQSSFNTITVTTPIAAAVGEAIFVNQYGEYRTESQLRHADHVVAKTASTLYPTFINTALASNSVNLSWMDTPVLLNPDAYFSASSTPGTPITGYWTALETYSCKLSGGSWILFTGFGANTAREGSGSNNYSITVLSSDGKTKLGSFLYGSSTFNPYAANRYNYTMAIVPLSNNTANIYTLSYEPSSTAKYLYSTIITWTGSTITVGSSTAISNGGWLDSGSQNPYISNSIFEYNSITYLAVANSGSGLLLINTSTNAITTIGLGVIRFYSPNIMHLVKAGTCLHIYQQTASVPVVVIDLTTMAVKTTGLSTFLTTTQTCAGPIIKLDSTTYAYQSLTSGNNWTTVRHSADGYTVTTTTTPGSSSDTGGVFSYRGRTFLMRMGTWGGVSGTGNRLSSYSSTTLQGEVLELTYNSSAATCTLSVVSDPYDYLPDLLNRLPATLSTKTAYTNLATCLYVLPVSSDQGRTSNSSGTFILQAFNYDHYTKYAPTYIGTATTSGTSVTVLLSDSVRKFTGAVEGTLYANVIGLPSGYAVELKQQDSFNPEYMNLTQTTSSGTLVSTSITSLEASRVYFTSLGSIAKTSDKFYYKNRVLDTEILMKSNSNSHTLVVSYVSNGRVKKQFVTTVPTSTVRGFTVLFSSKWECSWPILVTLSSAPTFGNSSYDLIGTVSEDFIC